MFKKVANKIFRDYSIPKEFYIYKKSGVVSSDNLSLEDLNNNLKWFGGCTVLCCESVDYLQSLIVAAEKNYPVQAYKLFGFFCFFDSSKSTDFIDIELLEERVLSKLKVGVAVITYNRIERLISNIENINSFSSDDLTIVVADDGSNDGTKKWCEENGISCISQNNSGVVANKNRALYYLHEIEQCDVSILLEDDCTPIDHGWDKRWALAALMWGHVNFAHKRVIGSSKLIKGNGEIYSPFISKVVTGQCTASSLAAFNLVGYLNPIFKGYGCGHVEWSERFVKQGFNGLKNSALAFPCINIGLSSEDAPTHKSVEDIQRNRSLKLSLRGDSDYVYPWATEEGRQDFISAVKESINKKYLKGEALIRELSEYEKNNNFFFIHISKTAGTSFRKSLEDKFNVLGDYGKESDHTDQKIKEIIYDEKDPLSLKKYFRTISDSWLAGHVSFSKYSDMVSSRNIITFLRDPVQQVLSHFNHYVAYHNFKGDIDDFLKKPYASNFQSKNLSRIPLGLIGYVGLTECYDESIALINEYYGFDLDVKNININSKKKVKEETVSVSLKNKIEKLNKRDIECFKEAQFIHKQREDLTKKNKDWVYSYFTINSKGILIGCAYYSCSSKAVVFDVLCNKKIIKTVTADGFYGGFPKVNFPRERYISVHLALTNYCEEGDEIEMVSKATGQKLNFKPLVF